MLRRRRDTAGRIHDPGEVYRSLRSMALQTVTPSGTGLVIDVPARGGFATIVALSDGTTSLYTSTGGGIIGAGGNARVAEMAGALLDAARDHERTFGMDDDDDELPEDGVVRFHLLTLSRRRRIDVSAAAFWGEVPHELAIVIAATQQLITALRGTSPS